MRGKQKRALAPGRLGRARGTERYWRLRVHWYLALMLVDELLGGVADVGRDGMTKQAGWKGERGGSEGLIRR